MKREKGGYSPYKTKATKVKSCVSLTQNAATLLRLGCIGLNAGIRAAFGESQKLRFKEERESHDN